jgi:hypothetical protein
VSRLSRQQYPSWDIRAVSSRMYLKNERGIKTGQGQPLASADGETCPRGEGLSRRRLIDRRHNRRCGGLVHHVTGSRHAMHLAMAGSGALAVITHLRADE